MQGHKDLLRCCHCWGSSGSTVGMSCYAKKPLLYLLKAIMKLPKVQDTSKRPGVPFTCKCKNSKSYSWRQRVRQKCKCQTLGKYSQKQCVPGSTHPNWSFLGARDNHPGETTQNCFNVRKKSFLQHCYLVKKTAAVWKMDHMKDGQQPPDTVWPSKILP